MIEHTPILIVGGGPVGFALALDLASRGQKSVLVEREVSTAPVLLAKATGLHERTMEMCRRWGIVDRVVACGFPQDFPGDSVYATSLTGFFIGRSHIPSAQMRQAPDSTPEKRQRCPQYEFDPLLARVVAERGHTDVRYGFRLGGLEQDADGVTAELIEVATGRRSTIRASYVVGCDGAGSTVRRLLGVPFEGRDLDYSLSAMIHFPALELPAHLQGGERYILIGPEGAQSVMTAINGRGIWRLTVVGSQEKLNPDTYDMQSEIRRALGSDDIEYEVLRVAPWRRSQCAAATFRVGRVLLAGDAAHTTSPTGGHGLNTGIGDVSDLGWMLPAVLSGWGGEGLLEAYDLERRPVAIRNSSTSTSNYRAWFDSTESANVLDPGPTGDRSRKLLGERMVQALYSEWNSLGIDLGFHYESPIIVPDDTDAPEDDPSVYVPTSRPGHRAPHAWLPDGRSTLDLFGQGFVLLRFGSETDAEREMDDAAREAGIPLEVVDITDAAVAIAYERRRLVLVRPDGHVAWRGDELPADKTALLSTVAGHRVAAARRPALVNN